MYQREQATKQEAFGFSSVNILFYFSGNILEAMEMNLHTTECQEFPWLIICWLIRDDINTQSFLTEDHPMLVN